jgi:hypothetical protein
MSGEFTNTDALVGSTHRSDACRSGEFVTAYRFQDAVRTSRERARRLLAIPGMTLRIAGAAGPEVPAMAGEDPPTGLWLSGPQASDRFAVLFDDHALGLWR